MKKSMLLIALLGTLASPAMATYFTAEYIGSGSAASSLPNPGGPGPTLAPGLYVQVLSGEVVMKNPAGSQSFTSGQFGFTPNLTAPPALVAPNPGLAFSPPAKFNDSTAGGLANPSAVDCEVR